MSLERSSRLKASLNSNGGIRVAALALIFTAGAWAQLPKGFYAWWGSPVVRDLNLNDEQRKQIRFTVRDYRPHLMELRAEVERAEGDLEYQFDQQPVDMRKANEAIDRLAAARSDLTRTLSQMSLKLRTVLTQQQWQELQRRRPVKGAAPLQQPDEPTGKK
jgi:Spy/CpxP family protein refolding chaperone